MSTGWVDQFTVAANITAAARRRGGRSGAAGRPATGDHPGAQIAGHGQIATDWKATDVNDGTDLQHPHRGRSAPRRRPSTASGSTCWPRPASRYELFRPVAATAKGDRRLAESRRHRRRWSVAASMTACRPNAVKPYVSFGPFQLLPEHGDCLNGGEAFITLDAWSIIPGTSSTVEVKTDRRRDRADLDLADDRSSKRPAAGRADDRANPIHARSRRHHRARRHHRSRLDRTQPH